jgi:V8-like Glu-specific endopeptidase
VGGTVSEPGAWPTQAALVLRGYSAYQGQQCGGTVIDRSWILTAAHCITDFDTGRVWAASYFDIVVGTNDLRTGGTRIPVIEVRRHPGFDPDLLANDVALLRLDRPVPNGTPIQALAPAGTDPAGGTDVVTIGWGETSPGSYPYTLREVTLDYRSSATCRADNGPAFVTASMVCAWRSGKSACYGDSGGPLLEDRDGTWVQVGVTSWGFECGVYTSVYARVSALSSWIRWQTRYGPHPNATKFVERQYLDLFGRPPTGNELFYGVAALEDGQSTAAFVAGLLDGPTYRARSGGVIRLYKAIFLREPDSGGLTFWMGEINRGVSLKRIADLMVRAPEFTTLYGDLDDGGFVDLVYDNVLGRAPSEGDRTYWIDELSSGRRTRGQVMVGFSESAEYRTLTDPATRVTAAFGALVRRVPTTAEMTQWTGSPTGDIARFLLTSWSYANRF